MVKTIKSFLRAEVGGFHAWQGHRQMVSEMRSISEALAYLDARWPEATEVYSDGEPVFLLSAGWRSGSTLVQRLLISGGDLLIWGEPYRNCNNVQILADSLRSLSDTHPRAREHFEFEGISDLVNRFVATLSPEISALLRAQISFFETLFEAPARERGFHRWGLKEVRFSLEHARYLTRLFPKSKIIFLYRNPFHAYRSYRIFPHFYSSWPSGPVMSARRFGQLWSDQVRSFLDQDLGGLVISLEQLKSTPTETTQQISEFIGSSLDPEVLNIHISGRGAGGLQKTPPPPTPWPEQRTLAAAVGDLATGLGYHPG